VKKEKDMPDGQELRKILLEVVGEEGCGVSCNEADIFQDEGGWKLNLCGFMEPWKLGHSEQEAGSTLRDLGSMKFGLS
jgi:hypothetical protein